MKLNLQLFGGRGGSSSMSGGGGSASLFTPPASGVLTRAQYDVELNKLANALQAATSTAQRNKVYNAIDQLEQVKVIN